MTNTEAPFLRGDQLRIAIACFLLWFLASIAQLTKYLGVAPTFLAGVLALLAILAATRWFVRPDLGQRSTITARHFIALWMIGVGLFAVLYPLSHAGLAGPGSDREDAINRGLYALSHGRFPYYARTYLDNRIAVMPGAFLMAAPFYAIGGAAIQNLFWLAIFLWFAFELFEQKAFAFFYAVLFFFASPAALDDFVVGGDATVNTMYVAVALAVAMWAVERGSSRPAGFAALFLGAALAARPIYAVAIPAVGAFVFQQRGIVWAIGFCAVAIAASLAIVLPFYLYDPANFTPIVEVTGKLGVLPRVLEPAILVSVIGMAVACLGFFKPLDRVDVYGVTAVALMPVLIPPMVFAVAGRGWSAAVLTPTSHAAPIAMLGGIWLMKRLEAGVHKAPAAALR